LLGAVSFAGMPYAVLMPVFAQSILHGGAQTLGVLMGCSGLGALIGALTLATRGGVRGLGRWVLTAAGAFGATLIVFFALTNVLAFGRAAGARRCVDDGSNGVVEHIDSVDGARCAQGARDGGLLHDVHGHGRSEHCGPDGWPNESVRR